MHTGWEWSPQRLHSLPVGTAEGILVGSLPCPNSRENIQLDGRVRVLPRGTHPPEQERFLTPGSVLPLLTLRILEDSMADKVKLTFRGTDNKVLAVYYTDIDKPRNYPTPSTSFVVEVDFVSDCGPDEDVLIDFAPAYCPLGAGHPGKCRATTSGGTAIHWIRGK